MRRTSDAAGFSLIEMIIVIAITGIVAAMVAVFLRAPLESYVAQDRRARLADSADTALRRIGRDIRLALPNSVRVTTDAAGVVYLEFFATRTGGRYRAQGGGDILDFASADTSFDVLGPPLAMALNDRIAVYNLGIPGADAWATAGSTLALYTGAGGNETNIAITAKQFPLASPGNRFQVVEGPVSYVCNPGAGTLTRYWGYTPTAAQPTSFTATPQSLLANRVSDPVGPPCSFDYQPGATERGGLVSMMLSLSEADETVRLYAAIQVSNQP